MRWLLKTLVAVWLVAGLQGATPGSDASVHAAYASFFGLGTSDGLLDPDGDGLNNHEESLRWTDPYAADTDRDGFADAVDDEPLSRAVITWGRPGCTFSNTYDYPGPAWLQTAFQSGGQWQTNIPAWSVATSVSQGLGRLSLDLDRAILTNDIVLCLEYFGHTNAPVYIDLYDSNDLVVVTNLLGNINSQRNAAASTNVTIPLAAYPRAWGIQIRRGGGACTVYRTTLYLDLDRDGLDREQEAQRGTSDRLADSDADGLSDYAEVFIHQTQPMMTDTDGDGGSDSIEVTTWGTNPRDADSDDDGINDGGEKGLGRNPLVADRYSRLPFSDGFESNTVPVGRLDGRNAWTATPTNLATVQTGRVYRGFAAAALSTTGGVGRLRQMFVQSNTPEMWLDVRVQGVGGIQPTGTLDAAAVFYINTAGRVVAYDGVRQTWMTYSNQPPVASNEWVRLSARLDFSRQCWEVYLRGTNIASALGFSAPRTVLTALDIEGPNGVLDDLNVCPDGMDIDGDGIPDAWELGWFGTLLYAPGADPDGDGLCTADEIKAGTNPALRDSDGDGMGDGAEYRLDRDPQVRDVYMRLPLIEPFEKDAVRTGPLNGQNGWVASLDSAVFVQTNQVSGGTQALAIEAPGASANASHWIAACGTNVVWADLRVRAYRSFQPSGTVDAAAAFYLGTNGQMAVYDGAKGAWVSLSNHVAASVDEWLRVTTKLDYAAKTWDVYLRGGVLRRDIRFAVTNLLELTRLSIQGGAAFVDDIAVTAEAPVGLNEVPAPSGTDDPAFRSAFYVNAGEARGTLNGDLGAGRDVLLSRTQPELCPYRNIQSPARSIQAVLDAINHGTRASNKIIYVACATYTNSASQTNRAVNLPDGYTLAKLSDAGGAPLHTECIIDLSMPGGVAGAGVVITNGQGSNTVVSGITIRGGTNGIVIGGTASPIIQDCVIIRNQQWGISGGTGSLGVAGVIRGCVITSNGLYGTGGGIRVERGSIAGCTVAANAGAGILSVSSNTRASSIPDVSIDRCRVVSNMMEGVSSVAGTTHIKNSLVIGNGGSAVYCQRNTARIINGTLVDNGSGLRGASGTTLHVLNTILWNRGDEAVSNGVPVLFTCQNSCIRGGTTNSSPFSGTGRITADPLLASDASLQPGSPCIDTGLDSAEVDPTDFYGEPRSDSVFHGNHPYVVDIGAIEWQAGAATADTDGDQMPDDWEERYGLQNAVRDEWGDADDDGFLNIYEYKYGSNPTDSQSRPAVGLIYVATNGSALPPYSTPATACRSIQTALHAAGHYGIVAVADGVYCGTGNRGILMPTNPVTLVAYGTAGGAVIDCQRVDRGITVSNCTGGTVLSGLKVVNGYTNNGAGFFVRDGGPQLIGCVAASNEASVRGGGAYLSTYSGPSTTEIRRCSFTGNWAMSGAGIAACGVRTHITDCMFVSNAATAGGGLISYNNRALSDVLVERTSFIGNGATRGGAVVAASLWGAPYAEKTTVYNACVFFQNRATSAGAAVDSAEFGYAWFNNCSFVDNTADGQGNVAYFEDPTAGLLSFQNCVVWGTNAVFNSGITTANRCVIRNGAGRGSNITTDDPKLIGGWRLSRLSPCIDAGDPAVSGWTDIDGEPVMDSIEHRNVVSATDIGADEWQGEDADTDSDGDGMSDIWERVTGLDPGRDDAMEDLDADGVPNVYEFVNGSVGNDKGSMPAGAATLYVSTTGSNGVDYSSGGTPARTLQAAVNAASRPYTIITVADGVYTGAGNGNITLPATPVLLRSASGPWRCVIDARGQAETRGFSLTNAQTRHTVVRGFTIQGGNTVENGGAGIRCSGASPTIEGCILRDNRTAGGGGGLSVEGSSVPLLVNCLFNTNTAAVGGGLCSLDGARPEIVNCTFISNASRGGAVWGTAVERGAAVSGYRSGLMTVRNSVLWGGGRQLTAHTGITGSVANTENNAGVDVAYSVVGGWTGGGAGVKTANPGLFADGRIGPGSTCLSNGVECANGPAVDIDGENRFDAPPVAGSSRTVDIGADEWCDTGADSDADGMNDAWEWLVVRASVSDAIEKIEHVLPGDDYDGDGCSNGDEIRAGSSPIDPSITPLVLGFDVADQTVSEAAGDTTVPVRICANHPLTSGRVELIVYVSGGTATPGLDFVGGTYKGYWEPGMTSRIVNVTVKADGLREPAESLTLGLALGRMDAGSFATVGRSTQTLHILDMLPDADADGLPDDWERLYSDNGSATAMQPQDDPDRDGWNNLQEYMRGTNPRTAWISDTGNTLKLKALTPFRKAR